MLHLPVWWLIWLVVVVVFAVVRGVFVRKASTRRERERCERAERPGRPGRPGLRRAGALHQSSQRASGQPQVTRDQLIAAGVITPADELDALPVTAIA